jgi:hypothetical protein
MRPVRYALANLGQPVGQNLILSRDFNSFYSTALDAASAIAGIARSKDLTDDERAQINQALGKIRDYTVPTVPPPAPCPSCPVCQGAGPCPECAPPVRTTNPLLVAGALVAGLAIGAAFL